MTQLTNGRTAAIGLFQAGDRPTDQNFTNLFDSILFLGETNPSSLTLTTIGGNVLVSGSLSSKGAFIVNVAEQTHVMLGKDVGDEPHNRPLQVYGNSSLANLGTLTSIIYASGSAANDIFEGVSGDSTSSILLTDPTASIRFGTHTNKGFLEIHGEEIITYSTGSSSSDNYIYMSGSLGIGTAAPAHPLVIYGAQDMSAQIQTTKTNGAAYLRFVNDARHWRLGVTTNDSFTLYDNTGTATPFIVEAGAGTNTLVVDSNSRVGIGTNSPAVSLHIVDTGDEIIRLQDSNAAGSPYISFYQQTTRRGLIQLSGSAGTLRLSSEYGDIAFETANTAGSGADVEYMRIKAGGNVGIGTDSPGEKLEVIGNISASGWISASGLAIPGLAIPGSNVGISNGDVYGSNTGSFAHLKADTISGSHTGDGSSLTNITGNNITGLISNDADNRVVTALGTGAGVNAESNLTFDGSKLIHLLNTGNTSNDGILIDGQNGGVLGFRNGTAAGDEFSPLIYGAASSGMTNSGVPGLYLRGRPAQDHANNPCIIIRGQNLAYDGVSTASDVLRIQNYTTDLITVDKDGKMGIGTTTPTSLLHINTDVNLGGTIGNDTKMFHLEYDSGTSNVTHLETFGLRSATGNDWTTQGTRIQKRIDNSYMGYIQFGGGDSNGVMNNYGVSLGVADGSSIDNPTGSLEIMRITGNGLVGIGTNSPDTLLHLSSSNPTLLLESEGYSNDSTIALRQAGSWPSAASGVDLVYDGGDDKFYIKGYDATNGFVGNSVSIKATTPANTLVLDVNGNISIGTSTPNERLTVDGNIELTVGTDRRIFMGGESLTTFGLSYNRAYPDYGIFYTEGSPDVVNISPNGTSSAGVMTLTGDGNVGIGTAVPKVPLHIASGTDVTLSDGSGILLIGDQDGLNIVMDDNEMQARNNAATSELILQNEGGDFRVDSNRLVVKDSGDVGIGLATPTGKLTIYEATGTAPAASGVGTLVLSHGDSGGKSSITFRSQANSTSDFGFISYHDHEPLGNHTGTAENSLLEIGVENDAVASSGDQLALSTDGVRRLYIQGNGDIGIGTTSPGAKLDVRGNMKVLNNLTITSSYSVEGAQINMFGGSSHSTDYIMDIYQDQFRMLKESSSQATIFQVNAGNNATISLGQHLSTQIGYSFYDEYATMSHSSLDDTVQGNYGFMQHSGGTSYMNASSGKSGLLRIANNTVAAFTATGFGVTGNCTASGYMAADMIYLRDQPPSGSDGQIILGATGDYAELSTEHGYYKFGMGNTSWVHNYTGATAGYYFDKHITTAGNRFSSYTGDLILERSQSAASADINKIVIATNETYFTQNNDIRFRVENGNTWIDNKLFVGGDLTSIGGTTAVPTVDLAIGDPDTGLDSDSANILSLWTAGAARMRLSSDSVRMFGTTSGYMIGANAAPNASATLHVKQREKTGTSGNRGIVCEDDGGTGYWNIHYSNGSGTGYDVTYGNVTNMFVLSFNGTGQNGGWAIYNDDGGDGLFTGQHRNIPQDGEVEDYISKVGYIVSSTGNIQNQQGVEGHEVYRPNINEALPKVKLSDTPKDKKAYGVVSDLEDPNSTQRVIQHGIWHSAYTKPEGDDRLIINSVGEGAVMVSNINGNIENGDYITTSAIEGIGMKQDDDLLHNYTVAKAVMNCDFSSNTNYVLGTIEHNGITYKTALIGCTYHCG